MALVETRQAAMVAVGGSVGLSATQALIVIAFYMTSNSVRALEARKNPLKIETYEIKPWFFNFRSHKS